MNRLRAIDARIPFYKNIVEFPYHQESQRAIEGKLYIHGHHLSEETIMDIRINSGLNGCGTYMSNLINDQNKQINVLKTMLKEVYANSYRRRGE